MRLIKMLLITFAIFLSFPGQSQEYDVNKIPEALLKDAYAVVRKDKSSVEVLLNNKYVTRQHTAITILDKSGDFLNSFVEYYDKFKKIKDARFNIYDRNGKRINSFKKRDFEDYSAVNGFSLYTDSRALVLRPHVNTYPYTIEYLYEAEVTDFISLPSWYPINDNVSVEKSEYEITVPETYEIKYKFCNIDTSFTITSTPGRRKYSVSISNLPASDPEPLSPVYGNRIPNARILPATFVAEEYPGSYNSWHDFGTWKYSLYRERRELDDEEKRKILEMTSGLENDLEKTLTLYDYLQNTTRYVNISLGLGGYQPHPAMSVAENGYGDCKALTNYMSSMLDVVGINSDYAFVYAGRNKRTILSDFPGQQFNHVILSVPLEEDTLWLECTSQRNPPGYLGRFTDDRKVLLVNENNSSLARTKKYSVEDNLQARIINATIEEDLKSLHATIHTDYFGQQFESVLNILYDSEKDQKEYLLKNIDIPQFEIRDFSINSDLVNLEPVGMIDLDLMVGKYLSQSGNRYFLPLNLMNKNTGAPRKLEERKNEVYLGFSYNDIDSIRYELPPDLEVEYLPDEIKLEEEFGSYRFECSFNKNTILVIREIRIQKGTYDRESYAKLVEFFTEISKADNSKALLKKTL